MSIITKKCTKCGEIGEFYVRKNGNPQDCCKKCFNNRGSKYQKNNLDRVRRNSKLRHLKNPDKFNGDRNRWAKENPDKRKNIVHNYYEKHKERLLNIVSKWRKLHPKSTRKYTKNWMKTHPFKSVEYNNKRKAMKLDVGGVISDVEWERLLETHNYTCLCCGRNDVKLTLDHVIPLSKGGRNVIENVQPLCGSCNSSKGAKIIDYRQ